MRGPDSTVIDKHRPHTALDAPVVLLDPVVQVSTFPDRDRFQPAPGTILQSICRVAGSDGFVIGLAAVDDDAIGPAMALQGFPEEALGRQQVAMLAEPEFDRVADAVDGAVEIHPLTANLDVGFVDMPFAGDGTLAAVEALQQPRREMNDPAMDRRTIDADAALGHHFFQVAQAQIVGQIPAHHNKMTDWSN